MLLRENDKQRLKGRLVISTHKSRSLRTQKNRFPEDSVQVSANDSLLVVGQWQGAFCS